MIDLTRYVVRHPQIAAQFLDGEAVLLLPTQGQVKVLNDVGARIWALADGSRTAQEIAQVIHQEYAVSLADAAADVTSFVATLLQQQMVTLQAAKAI